MEATDADNGTNADLRYYIDAPLKIKNVFEMNERTGVTTTSLPLDYETIAQYNLTLSVKDLGSSSLHGNATLLISIIDVNESPYFTGPLCITNSSCEFELYEEKPGGTEVGDVVKAADPDTHVQCQLTFNIISQDQAYFIIGKSTGKISTKKRLDRELKENYLVEIEVSDCGKLQLSEKRSVHIKLLDINDNSPKFPYSSYTIHVREDLNVSSVLPLSIHATGNLHHTYFLYCLVLPLSIHATGNLHHTYFLYCLVLPLSIHATGNLHHTYFLYCLVLPLSIHATGNLHHTYFLYCLLSYHCLYMQQVTYTILISYIVFCVTIVYTCNR